MTSLIWCLKYESIFSHLFWEKMLSNADLRDIWRTIFRFSCNTVAWNAQVSYRRQKVYQMVFICFTVVDSDRGCMESVGWQACLVIRVDSGILNVISCTIKDKCIMGLYERIVNVVISSCKNMFLLTDFQVLHFCWSLVSAQNTSEVYLWNTWRLKKKCWSSWSRWDSGRLNWVGWAAFLLFQITWELFVFIDVYWDGRRLVRSVFSAWDHADIISDPLGGLAQLTIVVQKINLQL